MWLQRCVCGLKRLFLGVVETIVGSVALMWVLFIVFPILCITSFGDCTCPQLPTYPSPKLTLTLTSHLGQNVCLGEGYVGSFPETYNKPNERPFYHPVFLKPKTVHHRKGTSKQIRALRWYLWHDLKLIIEFAKLA